MTGKCPATICALSMMAQMCLGQASAPPPATQPTTQPTTALPSGSAPPASQNAPTGPVVIGEKPDPSLMDLTFHPDPKDLTEPAKPPVSIAPKTAPSPAAEPAPEAAKKPAGLADQGMTRDVTAALSTPSKPYVIGPLDVLDIKVWNNANLSGFIDVGSDGMISMPLIGEIRADGLTKAQLTQVIRDKLTASVFTAPPEVTVQVARGNSKKYYVHGSVNRPGEFPLLGPTTVLDVFASTGGFQEFAKPNKIYILRDGKKLMFNYKEVSQGKNMKQNILIENGDHIFVP